MQPFLGLRPFEIGSTPNLQVAGNDATHLTVDVTFDPATMFYQRSDVKVLASVKFTHAGSTRKHAGAAVWVKDVTRYGFTGVVKLPERLTEDRSSEIHLEYFAYQVNLHRRTDLFEGGSVDIPKWDTGSRCVHVKPKVSFTIFTKEELHS